MYGKHGGGRDSYAIDVLWYEWGVLALGTSGVPTNTELVKDA